MRIKSKVWIGSVFCILSACLWGVSGAVGQYLFNQAGISPEWLVSARCLLTGLLLLVFYQVKHGGVFSIWMDKQDRIGIIIFALGGMLFMQYGYFAAIAHSNAATEKRAAPSQCRFLQTADLGFLSRSRNISALPESRS